MATENKDFKIKNGLIVQGATATVNGNNVITEASSVSDLSDVDASGATDLQALVYNASTGTWIPGEAVGGGSGSYTISATAPESPEAGDVWFDSTDGKSYIYYEDVDTSQWLEIGSRQPGPTGATGATGPQGEPGRFTTSDTEPPNPVDGDVWFNTSNGAILVYYTDADSSQWVESGYPVLGYQTIAGLTDTQISSLQDGEALVYDSTAGKWINQIIDPNPYNKSTSETGFLALPVGGDADRPGSPANGYIRFNTDSGEPEYYSETEGSWFLFRQTATTDISVQYLVVAGGGSGGKTDAGGGGAGGYLAGSTTLSIDQSYSVSVGAGGAAQAGGSVWLRGNSGGDSSAFGFNAVGGGGGGTGSGGTATERTSGGGGSSGGAGSQGTSTSFVGSSTSGQGFDGGIGATTQGGGGGGGASEVGQSAPGSQTAGNGGDGQAWVDGNTYAGGGGGGHGTPGSGGLGGGGDGTNTVGGIGDPGSINTGGGGGGGGSGYGDGGAGGSGIVALKYPAGKTLTIDSGLINNTELSGDGLSKITYFTAGIGTVTFS